MATKSRVSEERRRRLRAQKKKGGGGHFTMMNASRKGLYEAFSCQLPLPFLAPLLFFFSFLLVKIKPFI